MSKQKPNYIIRLSKNCLIAKKQYNIDYLEFEIVCMKFEIDCMQNIEKGYIHTITPESISDICEKPNGFIDIYLNCGISFFNVGFNKNDTLNIESLKALISKPKIKNMLNEKIFNNNIESILLTSLINKEKLENIKNSLKNINDYLIKK